MNKPRWNNKWQGLSDMSRAKNAAQGITEEFTMTEVSGALDVTTTPKQTRYRSYPNQQVMMSLQMDEVRKYLMKSWNDRWQLSPSTCWGMDEAMEWNLEEQEQGIIPQQTPSSSSTTQPQVCSAVLKRGPSAPVYLNTSTGEVPTP